MFQVETLSGPLYSDFVAWSFTILLLSGFMTAFVLVLLGVAEDLVVGWGLRGNWREIVVGG